MSVAILVLVVCLALGLAGGTLLRKLFYPQLPTPVEEIKMHAAGVKLNVNIGGVDRLNSSLLEVVTPCDFNKIEQALQRCRPSCPFINSISRHRAVDMGSSEDCIVVKLSGKVLQDSWQQMYTIKVINHAIYLCSNGNPSRTVFDGVLELAHENDYSVTSQALAKQAREVCVARVLNKTCDIPFHPQTPQLEAIVKRQVACYRSILDVILATTKNQ